MPRHYLGFDESGPVTFKNLRREGFANDVVLFLEEGEVADVDLDYAAHLQDGETVSSAAITASDVTVVSAVVIPIVTLTFSGSPSYGEAEILITLSTGTKSLTRFAVREKERLHDPSRRQRYCVHLFMTRYRKEFAEQAYKLCLLGVTDKELADFFGVSEQTINNRKGRHPTFLESTKERQG